MTAFSPREIVSELDRHIIGQRDAKRAVAIALRNRWRRQQLEGDMREEVLPKNILMIGPTGVGKTEISRRLAKLAGAPFIKVEATKFTEVGYVGRDVDQIVRDLLEAGIGLVRDAKRKEVTAKAQLNAEERVLDALVGSGAALSTREAFRKRLRAGELDDREIEIQVADTPAMPSFEIPGMPGSQVGMINLSEMLGKTFGTRTKPRKVTVRDSFDILLSEESDKLIDNDMIVQEAIRNVENNGIVFLDEIDKICARSERIGACQPRGRSARSLAADRRHHRRHQIRAGEDRPHSVHRLRRLPHRQALGPLARASGPASHPCRAASAHPRRFPPHPHRAEGLPHQAICRADEDRRRRSRIHRGRDRCHRRYRGGGEHQCREYRRAAPVHGDGAHSRGHLFDAADRAGEKIVIDAAYVEKHIGDLAKNADLSKFIL
jgi:ATP-dependent HslUV protease ATP-binding subunit HslU